MRETFLKLQRGQPMALLAAILCSISCAWAETLVVPNENEATPGVGSQLPFRGEDGRSQAVYATDQFGTVPTEGIIISEIAFRIDESDRQAYQGSIADLEVRMSTTPSLRPVITARFEDNIGADYRTVFRGKVDYVIPPLAEAVNPFHLKITLEEPFRYNARTGSLLVELLVHSGATGRLLVDAGRDSELAYGITGNTIDSTGRPASPLVIQLGFVPVPEASTLSLLFLGAVCILAPRRTRG